MRDVAAHTAQQRQAAAEKARLEKMSQKSAPPKFESYTNLNFNFVLPDRPENVESAEERHEKLVAQIKREILSQPADHALYLSTVRHLESAHHE